MKYTVNPSSFHLTDELVLDDWLGGLDDPKKLEKYLITWRTYVKLWLLGLVAHARTFDYREGTTRVRGWIDWKGRLYITSIKY